MVIVEDCIRVVRRPASDHDQQQSSLWMYYWASVSPLAALAEAAAASRPTTTAANDQQLDQEDGGGVTTGRRWSYLALPTVNAEDEICMDNRSCVSPNVPVTREESAACSMSPAQPQQAQPSGQAPAPGPGPGPGIGPDPYGFADLGQVILERLGPRILRAHPSTAQHKRIPHNDRIDIEAFRRKDPREWSMDDVIGWMISVAKKYQIPIEEMNMHRFANCTGTFLALMTRQNFLDRDTAYGHLLHAEFRKLVGDDHQGFLACSLPSASFLPAVHHQHQSDDQPGTSGLRRESVIKSTTGYGECSSSSSCTSTKPSTSSKASKSAAAVPPGKPRKRSQHTKGNKLWEFIRDALRDPATCPSVVRWEDEREGVFRIVESEKLARLWGEKKNNLKMTYEKLSRAMRTYYEKQILVPVPKTGLYPKKLVYKFGPNAANGSTSTSTTNPGTSSTPSTASSASAGISSSRVKMELVDHHSEDDLDLDPDEDDEPSH